MIYPADSPPYAEAFDDLARCAAIEHRRRVEMYPALVVAERFTQQQADEDTEAWAAIAADWQRVVRLVRPEAPDVYQFQKVAAIQTAIERARKASAKAGATDQCAMDRVIALEALLWHQTRLSYRGRRWHKPMIQFATDLNAEIGRVMFMGFA